MAKIIGKIVFVSYNKPYYPSDDLTNMSYEELRKFIDNDMQGALTLHEETITDERPIFSISSYEDDAAVMWFIPSGYKGEKDENDTQLSIDNEKD